MALRPRDFKSLASANFAIPADFSCAVEDSLRVLPSLPYKTIVKLQLIWWAVEDSNL